MKKLIILLMVVLMIMPACQNPRAVSISYREADDVDTFNFSEVKEVKSEVKEVKSEVKEVKSEVKEVKSDWYIIDVLGSISLICSLCFFVCIILAEQELDEENKMDRRTIENSVRPDGIQLYDASYLLPLVASERSSKYFLMFSKFCSCVLMYICSYVLANPI
jgi:hypothetical protein